MTTRREQTQQLIEANIHRAEMENWNGRKWKNLLQLPVVEPEKRLTVNVTTDDINAAKPNSHSECVFSQGCNHVNGVLLPWISKTAAYLVYAHKIARYQLPESVSREVVVNDRSTDHVDPGQYHFRPVKPSQRAEAVALKNAMRPHSNGGRKGAPARPAAGNRPMHTTKARVTITGRTGTDG